MTQSRILRAVFMVLASMTVSGCLYNFSDSSKASEPTASSPTTDPDKASEPVKATSVGPLGGYIEQFMDANDQKKMARALDGGLGKANRWKNPVSGASFSVTPLSKASGSAGGDICRNYSVSMTKSGITDRVNGKACIGEDGIWHSA